MKTTLTVHYHLYYILKENKKKANLKKVNERRKTNISFPKN